MPFRAVQDDFRLGEAGVQRVHILLAGLEGNVLRVDFHIPCQQVDFVRKQRNALRGGENQRLLRLKTGIQLPAQYDRIHGQSGHGAHSAVHFRGQGDPDALRFAEHIGKHPADHAPSQGFAPLRQADPA